jgi:serine/threonine-protein kinase
MRPSTDGGNKRSGSRYILGDLLGRGGMAEVFAGHAVGDHGFQKPVAIKRLLPELANDEVFVDRLIEEAKLLVGMQHGNIVSVLDLAREGDDVFLVMEFVDGPSLRQLIKARGVRGLSLGCASYIMQAAAAGLEFAHARPGGAIIHADISPSNLLLTTSGEVRVADFGIARREGLGHGVVEGKWAYMAPEQARGEPLSPRSDVFALGVVFYELLTGQHPFGRAVTACERDEQIQVIPPRVVKPSIPPGLDAICMRALAHSPRDRYGRMQQLIDALVEERFTSGYREGASDLAQAIRDVAPRSDFAPPRTMHTDRPVTLMTRSLLRDVTPAKRPSRPSNGALPHPAPPQYAAPQQFAAQPAVVVAHEQFVPVPTMAVMTTPLVIDQPPPIDEFPAVPSSGAQTVARMVDQVALAQAAQAAAAAMLAMPQMAVPAGLRADGTPMPPFRAAAADMRDMELASVVGGHTNTGHGPGIAIEPRGHRWTIAVLGLAALIGAGAAIGIQLSPSQKSEAATGPAAVKDALASSDQSSQPDSKEEARAKPVEGRGGRASDRKVSDAVDDRDSKTADASDGKASDTRDRRSRDRDADARTGDTGDKVSDSRARVDNSHDDRDAQASDSRAHDDNASDKGRDDRDARASDKARDDRDARASDKARDDRDTRTSESKARDDRDVRAGDKGRDDRDARVNESKARNDRDARASESKARDDRDTKLSDKGRNDRDARSETRSTDGRNGEPRGRRVAVRESGTTTTSGKRKSSLGVLWVESTPWSWVTVDIETKETPARFYLSPGMHFVKLFNQENGLTKYEKITVESNGTQKIKEDMEQ